MLAEIARAAEQNRQAVVAAIDRDAQNAAAIARYLRSLGYIVLDLADLEAAAARTQPIIPVLRTAISATTAIAVRAPELGLNAESAATLLECVKRLNRFLDLVERGRLAMIAVSPLDQSWISEAAFIRSQADTQKKGA